LFHSVTSSMQNRPRVKSHIRYEK